ncbi:MAG: pitrilysin family protein [Pseudomonadota bacterium]
MTIFQSCLRRLFALASLFRLFFSGLVFSSLVFPHVSFAQNPVEYQLDNGLKIIVKPDHRYPIAQSQIWYRVGSSYEPIGLTGVSHVLEHLMFQGTSSLKPGESSKIVTKFGGAENAFTNRDYTGYYQAWEKSRLPLSFAIEAERMTSLNLHEKEFQKERAVVLEERRLRTDDQPSALAYEQFASMAFITSPYRQPVIGWPRDLKKLELDDVQQWYDLWYSPNNAALIVVGDVNPEEVLQQAKKYFDDIPKRKKPEPQPVTEVAHWVERRGQMSAAVEVPTLYLSFNVPSATTAKSESDVFALMMLAGVLDGGMSARFETRLVRGKNVAASIGAGYDVLSRGDTLVTMVAIPRQGVSIATLEQAIWQEINELKTGKITTEEMQPVIAQLLADQTFKLDSISGQASELGELWISGLSWEWVNALPEALRKVTTADMQKVAQTYFVPERSTTFVLNPVPKMAENLENSETENVEKSTIEQNNNSL